MLASLESNIENVLLGESHEIFFSEFSSQSLNRNTSVRSHRINDLPFFYRKNKNFCGVLNIISFFIYAVNCLKAKKVTLALLQTLPGTKDISDRNIRLLRLKELCRSDIGKTIPLSLW